MRTVRHPSWLLAVGAALSGVLLGCDPEPHFDTPESPVPGIILATKSVVASPSDQQLGLIHNQGSDGFGVRVSIPGGAYPAGTLVTVRLLSRLDSSKLRDQVGLDPLVGTPQDRIAALQILPADRDPERPLRIELVTSGALGGAYYLLHARESDSEWSLLSKLDTSGSATSFSATQSGLWTATRIPSELGAGKKYRRILLVCGSQHMTDTPPVLLDLTNGVYTATTVNDQGCRTTKTAPTIFRYYQVCFKLATEVCSQLSGYDVVLTWQGGNSECRSTDTAYEYFTILYPKDPDPLPPEPADGCPPETGNLP